MLAAFNVAETNSFACPSRTFGKNICPEKESCTLVSVNGRI